MVEWGEQEEEWEEWDELEESLTCPAVNHSVSQRVRKKGNEQLKRAGGGGRAGKGAPWAARRAASTVTKAFNEPKMGRRERSEKRLKRKESEKRKEKR